MTLLNGRFHTLQYPNYIVIGDDLLFRIARNYKLITKKINRRFLIIAGHTQAGVSSPHAHPLPNQKYKSIKKRYVPCVA